MLLLAEMSSKKDKDNSPMKKNTDAAITARDWCCVTCLSDRKTALYTGVIRYNIYSGQLTAR